MSILWQDGFDLYASASDLAYNYTGNTGGTFSATTFTTTGGRFGGGALTNQQNFSAGFYFITKLLGSSNANMWMSFAAELLPGVTGNNDLIAFGAGSTNNNGVELGLAYNSTTGNWTFYKGSGTIIATVSYPMTSGWHWIDFRSTYNSSTGSIELWVDGVQVYNGTSLNTVDNAGFTGWSAIFLYGNNSWYLDDIIVYTPGVRLGDSRIETLRPTSDASPNQGTPLTGTAHYAMVNELQNSTTNYITMPDTSGDKEVFGIGSLSTTPLNIWSVKVVLLSDKSDAGSFQLEPLVISGGTEGDGSAQQLLTSYGVQQSIFATNPHTSAAWVYADVNAMDIGFKVF